MYRLVTDLLRPFSFLSLCTLAALVLLWRRKPERRGPKIALTVCLAFLTLLSVRSVGHLAAWSLESAYPPWDGVPSRTDTIVVFSGGYRVYDASGAYAELDAGTLRRCLHAVKLYRKAGGCRIVVSGGKVDPDAPGPTLARTMEVFLVDVGVHRGDILMEDKSRTTYENAIYTQRLLQERNVQRVILVTDAVHMFRSERCLRATGIEVIPAACNHRATWFRWEASRFLPTPEGVDEVDAAMHEWVGIAWYWLKGRI